MVKILTIFGLIWLWQGIRDCFMTEKSADRKKGIIEEKKIEYTKGLGKIELLTGVLFIAFDKIISHYLFGRYSALLFFAVMVVILIYFSKWSKQYIIKNEENVSK